MPADPPLAPHERYGEHSKAFEQMDRDELLAAARKWCYNAIRARDDAHQIALGQEALLTDYRHRIARCWALIGHGRKTVAANDLRAILIDEGVGEAAQVPDWRDRAMRADRRDRP